ncbi:hemolysin family protein [Bosea sp. (in: a-proteobacteria)]|uniref:hemolysin family protein n=1 Tax=Bosea sp. (in: a-proteobacteria) TaxID=1871050 RepID=UPI003B3A1F21
MSDDSRQSQHDNGSRGLGHWLGHFLDRLGLRGGGTAREDIVEALAEANGELADLSAQERAMLTNVLSLRERRVGDVMVPRADIAAVPSDVTLDQLLAEFRKAGHSRLPVFDDSLDEPRGMVHIRDFLEYIAGKSLPPAARALPPEDVPVSTPHNLAAVDLTKPLSATKLLRPVLYVPPSMPAVDLLVRMQATRTHIALVIDEYGGTDGLVSIEDLIEIVVGDIEDEHDMDEATIAPAGENCFSADARATLDELKQATGVDLSGNEVADDIDTLGGLIVTLAGRVPTQGEIVEGPEGLSFEVVESDQRRVRRLTIRRRDDKAPEEAVMEPG